MPENKEKKEILDSLKLRVVNDQAEKVAFTLQTTIELLEKTDPKSKKLKELNALKKRLVGLGKSILKMQGLKEIFGRVDGGRVSTSQERAELEVTQQEVNKIVKKLGVLLDSKVDTSALKKEIERKKEIITYLDANRKFLPEDKQKLNFLLLPVGELEALKNDLYGKEKVLEAIKAGVDFLPFSERVIDVASTSIAKLNELVARIEANKKTFEKFKAIDVFSSLTEKSLLVYFYKYLENKAKPAIETLVKMFNDIKIKAAAYKAVQAKVLAETKKITEIEARIAKKQGQHFEMPSFETMPALVKERNDSMLKSDFLEIFAKLLNNPVAEIKKYLASFDEAIEMQKNSFARIVMNKIAMIGQETLVDGYGELEKLSSDYNSRRHVAAEFGIPDIEIENRIRELQSPGSKKPKFDDSELKALEGQLKNKQTALLLINIGFLTKMIASLKFNESLLAKTHSKMMALASSPEEKRNLFAEFEAMKAGIKTRINSFLDQITDISFALKTVKDEETLRAELASGKELSPGSKAFAKRKADFLGKKLKRLDADFALADANSDIKRLGVIDDQKIALGFEKKVLEGKFSFEEALDIYWRLKATNPGLAENVKFYLESLGLKEMQKNIFENVDKGAVRFENDFASYFGGFSGKAIMNGTINVEYLESVQPKAAELINTLESNGYFLSDLKKARTSIGEVLKKLEGVGLENSNLYTSLTRASELYLNLESRYASTNDSDTYKFLNFVVNDASPETDLFEPASWKYAFETFVKIAVPIIIGTTIVAVLVIALGPASIPAYILGAAAGAVGQEAFKPLFGLESDFSPGNLAFNFATSALSSFAVVKGAGVVFSSLSKAAKFGRLGRVGKAVLKLAGKAANPASLRSPIANLARRLVSEPIQEVGEDFSQQLHPLLGIFASFANAADGMNLDTSNLSVEAARVVSVFKASDATFLTSTDTSVIFEVDTNKVDALLGQLKTFDGRILPTKADGSIVFAFKASPSSTSEVTFEFRPSTESSAVRNLMGSDMGLALQTDFGMALGQDGSYVYGEGKLNALKGRLENNGFVVQVAGDVVIAQKGDMQLTFKSKSLVSGTNIGAMENTRLQTVEAAEPGRMAEIRAGSTMGSQVVGLLRTDVADLWAGMKTSLETTGKAPDAMVKADAKMAAQVKTALDKRGLSENLLSGLSPVEQLQVLDSVTELEKEAGLAGDDKQFGDAVEGAKPGEDVFVNNEVGGKFLSPEKYMELLSAPDGFGIYRVGVLLVNNPVMPPFTVDQILKINEESPDLAAFVINKVAQTIPGEFSFDKIAELDGIDSNLAVAALAGLLKTPKGLAIREAYYNDVYSRFEGGKTEFINTAKDLFTKFSLEAFEKMQNAFKGLKRPALSLPVLALLTGCVEDDSIGGKFGRLVGKGLGFVGINILSAGVNVAIGLVGAGTLIFLATCFVVGAANAPRGTIRIIGTTLDGAKDIVIGAKNLIIKGGRGAMSTRTSAADAAKANQDTRNRLNITSPLAAPGGRTSDLLDFGAGVPGGPSADTDLATKAIEKAGRTWRNPEFRDAKSNFNILKTAIVGIENNIATEYIHPKLLEGATTLPTLLRLMGEAKGLANNLNAIITAPAAPGLPPGTPSPREIALDLLADKMIEINEILKKKINVPKKGSTTETEEKTVLDLLSEPLKMSDSPTLKEKLWNKRTRLILIVAAALAAVGGTTWALWPEKEPPPVVVAPPTPNEKAAADSAAAAATAAAERTGGTETYKPEGAKEKVDTSEEFDSRVSGALDHSNEMPAPIVEILERLQNEGYTDENLKLYEKLKADIVKTGKNGFERQLTRNLDWLPDGVGLQLRFVDTFWRGDNEKLVADNSVFIAKLTEAKAIFAGKDKDISEDFKALKTDEEKLKYFQGLVDDCARIIVDACK